MNVDFEEQQYLFDLNGYLVIENALTSEEVAELNALIDAQDLPPPPEHFPRFGSAAGAIRKTGPGFLQWGEPFCRLMDHPVIMSILRMRLGECFRLERLYGIYMRKGGRRGSFMPTTGPVRPMRYPRRASTTRSPTTACRRDSSPAAGT